MEKVLIKNLACCKDKTAPQFGCTDKYYKKQRPKRHKNYRKTKTRYKYKNQDKDIM